MNVHRTAMFTIVALAGTAALAQTTAPATVPAERPRSAVRLGPDGRLAYAAEANGDRVPDFSNCGYGGGGVPLPEVRVVVTLDPARGEADDTQRLQAAIDDVSARPIGPDGFRGALLLRRGVYRTSYPLWITQTGVVVRGEGQGEADGTVVRATGTTPYAAFIVGGPTAAVEHLKTQRAVVGDRVPVGARTLRVADASGLAVGDGVIVRRAGNAAWIAELRMDRIPERPDGGTVVQWPPFDLEFDRVITAVDGDRLTLDAPITCAIERRWGGGSVTKCDTSARVRRVGLENFRCVSDFDPKVVARQTRSRREYSADEAHCERIVRFDFVQDAWARDLTAVHMSQGVAILAPGSKWVTVQDCTSLEPVSLIEGRRRYAFFIDGGQLSLFRGCASGGARHAFVVGGRVAGPNVFLECRSFGDLGASEPHHRWSVGGLYDNCEIDLAIQDRGPAGTGHGWSGANYVVWNGRGRIVAQTPPTANTWVIGHAGTLGRPMLAAPRLDATFESWARPANPRSLYLRQLEERLGDARAAAHAGP